MLPRAREERDVRLAVNTLPRANERSSSPSHAFNATAALNATSANSFEAPAGPEWLFNEMLPQTEIDTLPAQDAPLPETIWDVPAPRPARRADSIVRLATPLPQHPEQQHSNVSPHNRARLQRVPAVTANTPADSPSESLRELVEPHSAERSDIPPRKPELPSDSVNVASYSPQHPDQVFQDDPFQQHGELSLDGTTDWDMRTAHDDANSRSQPVYVRGRMWLEEPVHSPNSP